MNDLWVGASVCPVHSGKKSDRIRMPSGIIGRTGPGMRHVGFGDRSTGMSTFGGEFGARHCNQWGYQWGLTLAATRPSSQSTLGRLVGLHIRMILNNRRTLRISTVISDTDKLPASDTEEWHCDSE